VGYYADGEVLGVDVDGGLICWNAETQTKYNCGETLEQYGEHNLSEDELIRIGAKPSP
jgi:hypothetical protein